MSELVFHHVVCDEDFCIERLISRDRDDLFRMVRTLGWRESSLAEDIIPRHYCPEHAEV